MDKEAFFFNYFVKIQNIFAKPKMSLESQKLNFRLIQIAELCLIWSVEEVNLQLQNVESRKIRLKLKTDLLAKYRKPEYLRFNIFGNK